MNWNRFNTIIRFISVTLYTFLHYTFQTVCSLSITILLVIFQCQSCFTVGYNCFQLSTNREELVDVMWLKKLAYFAGTGFTDCTWGFWFVSGCRNFSRMIIWTKFLESWGHWCYCQCVPYILQGGRGRERARYNHCYCVVARVATNLGYRRNFVNLENLRNSRGILCNLGEKL